MDPQRQRTRAHIPAVCRSVFVSALTSLCLENRRIIGSGNPMVNRHWTKIGRNAIDTFAQSGRCDSTGVDSPGHVSPAIRHNNAGGQQRSRQAAGGNVSAIAACVQLRSRARYVEIALSGATAPISGEAWVIWLTVGARSVTNWTISLRKMRSSVQSSATRTFRSRPGSFIR
jgi:hypothetical protein